MLWKTNPHICACVHVCLFNVKACLSTQRNLDASKVDKIEDLHTGNSEECLLLVCSSHIFKVWGFLEN